MKNWKVLIVTAGQIIPEYYAKDPCFDKDRFVFFNVSDKTLESDQFKIINSNTIDGYKRLGKDYAESEVIYNVTKLNLFKDVDYLGLIHYDFNLYSVKYDTYRITDNIDRILDKRDWISFFPASLSSIFGMYNVLMDERKPNCLFVRDSNLEDPISANDIISKEIGLDLNNINKNNTVALCCSFLVKRETFSDIGNIVSMYIESHIFEKFDTQKRHRFPGQFMERVVALYSLKADNKFDFRLDHRFVGGMEINKNDPNGENY